MNSKSRYAWAYTMIAPTLIGTLVFWFWPAVYSIYLGFLEVRKLRPRKPLGRLGQLREIV